MHALGHRSNTLIVVVTVVLTIGCRGSRPFGRVVQVSQEPHVSGADIEAPPQRLTTTKPRTDVRSSVANRTQGDEPVAGGRLSSRTPAASASSTNATTASLSDRRTDSAKSPANARISDASQSPSRQSVAARQPSKRQPTTPETAATSPQRNTELTAEALEAMKSLSPELQALIRQQMIAAAKQNANPSASESPSPARTSQPNALDSKSAMKSIPTLPKERDTAPEVPPKRIVSKQPATDSAVASLTDKPDLPASGGNAQGSLTDIETTELEPATVQAIPDTDAEDQSSVKTASASRGHRDQSMVATASIDADTQSSSHDRSDAATSTQAPQELYATLLKQLSQPPANESEAERSSRLIRQRLMLMLSGDPDAAVKEFGGMPKAEQEYLRHQLLGLWTMIDPDGHPVPSHRFTTALPQLREAARFAAAATDSLEVRSLAFCTEIESYGQIKTFDGNRFDAGQQVILYCEIENFTAKKTDGGFETHLQGSYDIYNADNEKVVSQLLPADKQVSANYLRDYFIAYQMHLPQQLSPGTYRLQLTMEDVNKKKYGQASIPLEIAK